MIKLIATDIDGTLLKDGTLMLDPEYMTIIEKLIAKGGRTDPGPPGALCPDHAPGAGGGGRGAGPPLLRPGGAGGIDP